MRWVVIILLGLIVASLASALLFLFRDQDAPRERMVKALSLRVGLSLALFLLLIVGKASGLINGRL